MIIIKNNEGIIRTLLKYYYNTDKTNKQLDKIRTTFIKNTD